MCSAPWPHPLHGPTKCGQCMECRLSYSREWAIRMTHESRMHAASCFLTLTYDSQYLPPHGQLLKRDLQLFFKRLRKIIGPFRYVACGEYGELRRRPHFHVALFGHDFSHDRLVYSSGVNGDALYTSNTLDKAWQKGISTIGGLTFESCAYIARYITKRISGIGASPLPLGIDPLSGECVMPNPEFLLCSRRPGIGDGWYNKFFMVDVMPHGRVITAQGSPAPVPGFYKRKLRKQNLAASRVLSSRIQSNQVVKPFEQSEDRPERRAARTTYAKSRTGIFKRDKD